MSTQARDCKTIVISQSSSWGQLTTTTDIPVIEIHLYCRAFAQLSSLFTINKTQHLIVAQWEYTSILVLPSLAVLGLAWVATALAKRRSAARRGVSAMLVLLWPMSCCIARVATCAMRVRTAQGLLEGPLNKAGSNIIVDCIQSPAQLLLKPCPTSELSRSWWYCSVTKHWHLP